MTLDQFFQQLSDVAPRFVWETHPTDLTFGGMVRGRCDRGPLCPLTALYLATVGRYLAPTDFDQVYPVLGLAHADAYQIVAAADGWELGGVRRRLYVALGLAL